MKQLAQKCAAKITIFQIRKAYSADRSREERLNITFAFPPLMLWQRSHHRLSSYHANVTNCMHDAAATQTISCARAHDICCQSYADHFLMNNLLRTSTTIRLASHYTWATLPRVEHESVRRRRVRSYKSVTSCQNEPHYVQRLCSCQDKSICLFETLGWLPPFHRPRTYLHGQSHRKSC
jgi:hypothetical protein